ncbi:vacuolar protein sorting-associated protein 62 [Tanacetum coccineum]
MKPRVNFRPFVKEERLANHDIVLHKSAIDSVSNRYANSLFASKVGLEKVLERGPWMIRNSPIILSKWSSYVSMTPKEVTKVSGRISYARALVEISAGTDIKTEVSMDVPNEDGEGYTREFTSVEYEWKLSHCRDCKVFGHSHDTCPKHVSIQDPNATTKADHSIGFTEVKRKKNKGRKIDQQPKARNSGGDGVPKPKPNAFRFNKPQLKDYRPKQASQAAQGKSDSLKPTSNPFDSLNALSEEDISGSQKPISCNIGMSSRVKKKNLIFSPQPTIHYFDRDDTNDANMDVGAECGAFSSTDTQNEDLEFDEEVDEHIFPEGDKFDIRLKGRSGDFAQGASDFPEFEVSKAKYFKKYVISPCPTIEQIKTMINSFAPLIYFLPDEEYFPSSVPWFFKNGGSYLISNLMGSPMMPFNGPAKLQLGPFIIPLGKAGQHVSDWKHMRLRIDNLTGSLKQIYLNTVRKWLKATEFEYKDGRPVMYASFHTHAHYNAPKSYIYYDAEIREFTSAYPRKSMLFSFPIGRVDKAAIGDCVFDILATPSSYEIVSLVWC